MRVRWLIVATGFLSVFTLLASAPGQTRRFQATPVIRAPHPQPAPSVGAPGDDCQDLDGDGLYPDSPLCPAGLPLDCDDTSSSCTVDCSDADGDSIPDCRDGCPTIPFVSSQVQLSNAGTSSGSVLGFRVSPDGSQVVYEADEDGSGASELYGTDPDGNAVARLSGAGTLTGFEIASTNRVIYRANETVPTRNDLYSVPLPGGSATRLTTDSMIGPEFSDFAITPDGERVLFRYLNPGEGQGVFSVATPGGPTETVVPACCFFAFEPMYIFSADSRYVLLRSGSPGDTGAYSVPVDGSDFNSIGSGDLVPNLAVSPDSTTALVSIQFGTTYRTRAVPIDGSATYTNLCEDPANIDLYIDAFGVTPETVDGTYRLVSGCAGVPQRLSSFPIGGGPESVLDPAPIDESDTHLIGFSHGGNRVVYQTAASINSVSVLGGTILTLASDAIPGGASTDVQLTPDGVYVVYRASTGALVSAPSAGAPAVVIESSFVDEFQVSPNSDFVAFRSAAESSNKIELFSARLDGSGRTKLNDPLPGPGDVEPGIVISSHGRVFFRADGTSNNVIELYSVHGQGHTDADQDGIGDACDACPVDVMNDIDADGLCANVDNCPDASNADQQNADGDAFGDVCDNCPATSNPDQADADADGTGDDCDTCTDLDGDGAGDPGFAANTCPLDNCALESNPSQLDSDSDGIGDRCDLDDGILRLYFDQTDRIDWGRELGFTGWNLYRGDLSVLGSTGVYTQAPGSNVLANRYCGLTDPWQVDSQPIGVGSTAFYLAAGFNGAGEQELGDDSAGIPRPNTTPCP